MAKLSDFDYYFNSPSSPQYNKSTLYMDGGTEQYIYADGLAIGKVNELNELKYMPADAALAKPNFPDKFPAYKEEHKDQSAPRNAIEFLEYAEEAMDELGWIKGTLANTEGVCLLGALSVVNTMHGYNWEATARTAIQEAIKNNMNYRPVAGDVIPAFNDSEGTTLEDIKLVFKHARHNLENQ